MKAFCSRGAVRWSVAAGFAVAVLVPVVAGAQPYGPCSAPPTPLERRVAMHSVYYFSHHASDARLPEAIRPVPLLDAASILRCDRSTPGQSRARRAIVKLAASVVEPPAHPQRRAALSALGAPLEVIDRVVGGKPGLTREAVELEVWEALGGSVYGTTCETGKPQTVVSHLPDGSNEVTTRVRVKRDFEKLRTVVDPQSWSACSCYFASSFVTEDFVPDEKHDVEPKANPPAPGTTWSEALFEDFHVEWNMQSMSRFKTLLDIDAKRVSEQQGAREHVFTFELRDSLWSRVGAHEIEGGIGVDFGHTRAVEAQDGSFDVEARKTLRFDGRPLCTPLKVCDVVLNGWAYTLLLAMGDEIAEGLCCDPAVGACEVEGD